jgi:hypothetical protein
MKSPRANLYPAICLSPKTNNHLQVSGKAKECKFEMNVDARKNAHDIKRRSKCFLPHNQQDFNEVQHASSADEHRHERAGIDTVVADFMEDRRELCVCACPPVMRGDTVKHALTSTSSPPSDVPFIPWNPVVLPLWTPWGAC